MELFILLTSIPLWIGVFVIFLVIGLVTTYSVIYMRELISVDRKNRPPIAGSIFILLLNFKRIFDCHTFLARKYPTFRLIDPSNSVVFTANPTNIEHILKTNFSNYGKGEDNCNVLRDLLGNGIFAVDGERWRHQRKLASYEFSTKVLRDFSSSVFRRNAAKFISKISESSAAKQVIDLHDLFLKSTLDSIFKVGFGVDLDTMSGCDDFSNQFMNAFDESNSIIFWRFVDLSWKIKRFLNIGSEAILRKNIKIIDTFVYDMIK